MTKKSTYLWGVCLILGIINHFFVYGQARIIIPLVLAPALFLYWSISLNQFSEVLRINDPFLYHAFRDSFQGHYVIFAKEVVRATCPNRFQHPHSIYKKARIKIECQNEKIINQAKIVLEFYESGILLYAIVFALSVF